MSLNTGKFASAVFLLVLVRILRETLSSDKRGPCVAFTWAWITNYYIAPLVYEAFTRVAWLDGAMYGFKYSGICLFHTHLFSHPIYLGAVMTNIPIEEPANFLNIRSFSEGKFLIYLLLVTYLHLAIHFPVIPPHKNRQILQEKEPIISTPNRPISSDPDVVQIVRNISPLPNADIKRSAARTRKCEWREILTSSPYQIAAEVKEDERTLKKNRLIREQNSKPQWKRKEIKPKKIVEIKLRKNNHELKHLT